MSRPRSPDRPSSRERRGSEDIRVRWRVDHEKSVLLSNFERRSWPRSVEDGEWNFYWASPHSVKQIFNPENNIRLADQQVLNHFPNHYELTRKDLMVKNLKRYKKELERVNAERAAESGCAAADLDLECIPTTFILPNDFSLFAEEFRKQEHAGRRGRADVDLVRLGPEGWGYQLLLTLLTTDSRYSLFTTYYLLLTTYYLLLTTYYVLRTTN